MSKARLCSLANPTQQQFVVSRVEPESDAPLPIDSILRRDQVSQAYVAFWPFGLPCVARPLLASRGYGQSEIRNSG